MTILNASLRDKNIKNYEVRNSGLIPAIFYGFNKENTPISVNKIDFIKVFREVGETNTLTLKTENNSFDVLVHEVQHDPITNEPIHIDFLAVDMNKEVEVDVPLEFENDSPAVKAGGILVKVMHEVKVSALPSKVPHAISVDISSLVDNESVILLKDIKLPEGVKVVDDLESVVASISVAKEESLENTPAPDLSSIEVEAKGKKEEEGGEAAA